MRCEEAAAGSCSPGTRRRVLAARGEMPAAFDGRCIPAGCVAPPSNIPDILSRRALPSGRLAVLGATMDSHHGLLDTELPEMVIHMPVHEHAPRPRRQPSECPVVRPCSRLAARRES